VSRQNTLDLVSHACFFLMIDGIYSAKGTSALSALA
jgi:hypothetical protein